jgi:hypothetical protein
MAALMLVMSIRWFSKNPITTSTARKKAGKTGRSES